MEQRISLFWFFFWLFFFFFSRIDLTRGGQIAI